MSDPEDTPLQNSPPPSPPPATAHPPTMIDNNIPETVQAFIIEEAQDDEEAERLMQMWNEACQKRDDLLERHGVSEKQNAEKRRLAREKLMQAYGIGEPALPVDTILEYRTPETAQMIPIVSKTTQYSPAPSHANVDMTGLEPEDRSHFGQPSQSDANMSGLEPDNRSRLGQSAPEPPLFNPYPPSTAESSGMEPLTRQDDGQNTKKTADSSGLKPLTQ